MERQQKTTGCKWWSEVRYGLIVLLLALCCTAMRFEVSGWQGWWWPKIYNYSIGLPFGKRILTAWLAHVGGCFGLDISRSFELVELIAIIALLWGTGSVLSLYLGKTIGRVIGLLIIGIIPVMFMIVYTVMLPWDSMAMALTVWGIYGLLSRRWGLTAVVMVLASCNRETALLLPALFAGMYADRRPWWKVLGYVLGLVGIYSVCQWLIGMSLSDNEVYYNHLVAGTSLRGGWGGQGQWRIIHNLMWLNEAKGRCFVVLGALGGLPIWFLGVLRRLPGYLRRFGLVAWGYGWMLVLVGNVYEPRLLGEIAVLLFVPVALGVCDAVNGGGVLSRHSLGGEKNGLAKWMVWLEGGSAGFVAAVVVSVTCLFAHGWPY